MFNDTKLASLIKRDPDVMGLKENNIYYLIIDRCFCIKIARLSQYPKFMAKLFSMDKLLPDGELLKGNSDKVKPFFDADVENLYITGYTGIDINTAKKETVGIWSVGILAGYASGAYAKRYTDAVELLQGRSATKNKSPLYFVDNTGSIEAIVSPWNLDIAEYLKKVLPSVCKEIQKECSENG